MNIDAIKDRLALLEAGGVDSESQPVAGITNIKRAYAQGPASLPESDMPLFVNFTGPTLSFQNIGGIFYREKRQFNCRLYVAPVQKGIDGEAERKVEPFIEPCMRQFLKHASLGDGEAADLIAGIFTFTYLGDTGITVLNYANTPYLGVEFRVAVEAVIEQEYATLE
ncbi:MAG TPA: hypothetical protein PKD65_16140 [Nitrospira sp.]|nr:hypothetical protein [Nitrospira sp.]